jgi:hypothetical protein
MKISDILKESRQVIAEGAHIVHPEDLVWSEDGIGGAQRAIAGLELMAKGKELTTIKWDGFPALVFGRNVDGQLMITDKHMFDKRDGTGRVTSADAFRQYDANRGADRADLYDKIDLIWPVMERLIPTTFRGFYMGDLLYAGKPPVDDGFFVFRPNTVTYRVRVNSNTGLKIAESIAGIAVHTFIPGIGEGDQPLKGLGGLPDHGAIWFVSGEMPVPAVKMDATALNAARAALSKYGSAITDVKSKLAQMRAKGVITLISQYITAKINSGSLDHMLEGYYDWLRSVPSTKLSDSAKSTLLGDKNDGWLYTEGRAGLEGIFAVWVAIYNLKLSIKQQIDTQQGQGDIQAFTGTDTGHEGYVVGGGDEKFKLIDRLGFTRANNEKNQGR